MLSNHYSIGQLDVAEQVMLEQFRKCVIGEMFCTHVFNSSDTYVTARKISKILLTRERFFDGASRDVLKTPNGNHHQNELISCNASKTEPSTFL